jgi:thiosulfate/3-mercaptopyruvate sulfurtransferase
MTSAWVVSQDWLADNLGAVRVVDVRDAWEYDGIGHLPTAGNVPFEEFRGGGEVGMLPSAARWAELLGGAGVASDDHVVAYDDTHGVFAARFLVTALLLGHDRDRLHLLDGDYSAWTRERTTTTDPPEVEATEYRSDPPAVSPLVSTEDVAAATEDDGTIVVDTRAPEEFEAGHVPGAVNLDWRALVDDDTRGLREREALLDVLTERGLTPDRRIVLYCNTARRISHTFWVLGHLGFEDVAFYEGSLTEWLDAGRPLSGERADELTVEDVG